MYPINILPQDEDQPFLYFLLFFFSNRITCYILFSKVKHPKKIFLEFFKLEK